MGTSSSDRVKYPKGVKRRYVRRNISTVLRRNHEWHCRPPDARLKRGVYPSIVVVLGAGASNAAASLPAGALAAKLLTDKLQVSKRHIKLELDRLEALRLNREEFETQLLALSKFDPVRLADHIQNIYGRRYNPSLQYEILAHMLKHRYIDAIINFNFDQLLDQAIEDEIGVSNCFYVVGTGTYRGAVDEMGDRNGRFDRPLYIKPHGTAEHASSLRFTREQYFFLSGDSKSAIQKLFRAPQMLLIIIGFNMQSYEFNQLIKAHLLRSGHACAIVISSSNPLAPQVNNASIPQFPYWEYIPVKQCDSGTYCNGIGKEVQSIYKELQKSVGHRLSWSKGVPPRGIKRHELVAALFQHKSEYKVPGHENVRKERTTLYLRDRSYVELALAIAKAKGFLHISQLAQGRTGRYLALYNDRSPASDRISLVQLCSNLCLEEVDYSGETRRIAAIGVEERSVIRDRSTIKVGCDEFRRYVDELVSVTLPNMLSPEKKLLLNGATSIIPKLFKDALWEMYKGDEVEVDYPGSTVYSQHFANPRALKSSSALKAYSNQLLKGRNWDTLLCIAETGKWLLEGHVGVHLRKRRMSRVAIVLADDCEQEGLEKNLKLRSKECKPTIERLPWWLHNQHMTLILNGKDLLVGGVAFERRLRSANISPIWLGAEDRTAVLRIFFAYLIKAERRKSGGVGGFVGADIVTKQEVDDRIERFFEG